MSNKRKAHNVASRKAKKAKTDMDIVKLLDFDVKQLKSEEDFSQAFKRIATTLMSNFVIVAGGDSRFQFLETEFYYRGEGHMDYFTHCDDLQSTMANWYFHKTGSGYKGGTYKGIDITFGKGDDCFGGILIRAIKKIDPDKADASLVSDGPCKVVDALLKAVGKQSVAGFADDNDNFDVSIIAKDDLYVAYDASLKGTTPPIRTPRVGLTLKSKTDNRRPEFVAKPYRFVSRPDLVKKGKQHMVLGMHNDGFDPAEISKQTKVSLKNIAKYIGLFDEGKELSDEFFFHKALKVDVLCKMIGALGNLREDEE